MAQRTEWTLDVTGMSCMHCARAVDEALREVPGVVESTTQHAEGRSVVVAEPTVASPALIAAVERAGYRVVAATSRTIG
jgi:Cu+-exporting ATPase